MFECEQACLLRRLLLLKGVEPRLGIILIWGQVLIRMRVHPESKVLMLWLVMAMFVTPVTMKKRVADQRQQK